MELPGKLADAMLSQQKQGNSNAAAYYTRLYTRHRVWLLRHVIKFGVSPEDAEEVVQEAFVRLLKQNDVDPRRQLRSYLQRVATNITIDRYRQQTRKPETALEEVNESELIIVSSPSAETETAGKETLKLLHNVLQELSPKCREAFYRYKVAGDSYTEIASTMGITESMVRKYVLQALRYSYSQLKDYL